MANQANYAKIGFAVAAGAAAIVATLVYLGGVLGKGDVIASGVNEELDELRKIARHGKDYLLEVQQREIERTGISSLKIGFNNVFGPSNEGCSINWNWLFL